VNREPLWHSLAPKFRARHIWIVSICARVTRLTVCEVSQFSHQISIGWQMHRPFLDARPKTNDMMGYPALNGYAVPPGTAGVLSADAQFDSGQGPCMSQLLSRSRELDDGSDMNVRSDSQVAGARGSVARVHEEMRDVENVLLEMERENANLRTRLLHARSSVWEKYFMCSGHLALQACVGCWKSFAEQERADREADGYSQRQARESAKYEKRVKELEEEAETLRQQCQRTREETAQQVAPLRAAHEEAMLRAERLEALISQMGEVANRVTQLSESAKPGGFMPQCSAALFSGTSNLAATELVKSTLHQILRDIDPNYVPPKNTMTEVRSTTPVLVRSTVMTQPAKLERVVTETQSTFVPNPSLVMPVMPAQPAGVACAPGTVMTAGVRPTLLVGPAPSTPTIASVSQIARSSSAQRFGRPVARS